MTEEELKKQLKITTKKIKKNKPLMELLRRLADE